LNFDDSIENSGDGSNGGNDQIVTGGDVKEVFLNFDDSVQNSGDGSNGGNDQIVTGDDVDTLTDSDFEVPNSTTTFIATDSTIPLNDTKDVVDQHEIPNSTSVSNTNISIVINHDGRNDTSKKFK
jgi:hypothetical protein